MASFLFKPPFDLLPHPNSIPNLNISTTHSFSFPKSPKKSKLSPVSASKSQSTKTPLWGSLPSVVQCVRIGGCLLKAYLDKWGALFRSFKARDEDSTERLVLLQSGGIGVTLLSVTSNAKVKISPFIATLAANPTFVSAVLAWMSAQSMKIVLNFFVERRWDFRILFASGGMPSSHTALCTALTTSVALCHGVADSLFPVCLGFSLIVMYDAIGVRRHAGMQAEVLNMIIADLFQGHPISQRKLKELLGHTPSQVLAGAFLGILVACLWCQRSLVPA